MAEKDRDEKFSSEEAQKRSRSLFGIEAESPKRDLYTFECIKCGGL
jgi:hypothetical protein